MGLELAKVERVVVADGERHIIECAVRADHSVPAEKFLDELAEGQWLEDTAVSEFPDDAQIAHHDKLLAWFQILADDGVPPYNKAANDLDAGIWEFKLGTARVSYFDTDAAGGFTPKFRIRSRDQSDYADTEFWWYPVFDETLRLGHCFSKDADQTDPKDIAQTKLVRKEDLEHDE